MFVKGAKMAKKNQTVFVCQECGYESPKWMGQCICGAWNSFVEEKVVDTTKIDHRRRASSQQTSKVVKATKLKEVGTNNYTRIDTGIKELNRVLGGGLVKGSLTLISGEPGIGKSTLIIQAATKIAEEVGTVLYVSGEESEEQIKMRADRVCPNMSQDLYILSETNMENIIEVCNKLEPKFLIIDSIQTMYTAELDSVPGSVSQVRACGNLLMNIGKTGNVPIFIVAHVTKNGELAGPKIVEHMVDCVLNFSGERNHDLRILRAFKNRFGTTSEIGAFKMEEEGLTEIHNLSATFLDDNDYMVEGSMITAVYEGSRPVLLEVQGLTATTNVGFSRRTSVGIETQRLNMILAVLEKKAGLPMVNQDVYVNVVGGLKVDSPSVDLAVALAIYSSLRNTCWNCPVLVVGEVGLTGEIRSIQHSDKILNEAMRMGYKKVVLPRKNYNEAIKNIEKYKCIELIGVRSLSEAIYQMKNQ